MEIDKGFWKLKHCCWACISYKSAYIYLYSFISRVSAVENGCSSFEVEFINGKFSGMYSSKTDWNLFEVETSLMKY